MNGVEFKIVEVEMPKDSNVIIGQSHFIKTVEDLYETLIESGMGIKFGLAFCEASGKRLIRSDGNDADLQKWAEKEAMKIGAGHTFVIFIKNAYPVNIVNRVQNVSEVTTIFAATANPVQVVVAETAYGRGVMGVVDGEKPLGVEGPADRKERKDFLRKLGYKR
ncbi:MAG: adenosine-specific kinase [Candidatus Micrarchaeota archaeon]